MATDARSRRASACVETRASDEDVGGAGRRRRRREGRRGARRAAAITVTVAAVAVVAAVFAMFHRVEGRSVVGVIAGGNADAAERFETKPVYGTNYEHGVMRLRYVRLRGSSTHTGIKDTTIELYDKDGKRMHQGRVRDTKTFLGFQTVRELDLGEVKTVRRVTLTCSRPEHAGRLFGYYFFSSLKSVSIELLGANREMMYKDTVTHSEASRGYGYEYTISPHAPMSRFAKEAERVTQVAVQGSFAIVANGTRAHVYSRQGRGPSEWTHAQTLERPGATDFGRSISIHGEWLWIAYRQSREGFVGVWKLRQGAWQYQESFRCVDVSVRPSFGLSISVGGDGQYGLVGSDGYVYIYLRTGDRWIYQERLNGAVSGDYGFGEHVTLSPFGEAPLWYWFAVRSRRGDVYFYNLFCARPDCWVSTASRTTRELDEAVRSRCTAITR